MTLKKGPYGYYVQLGEAVEGEKPRRASIPKGIDPATLELERALELLSLPRLVGRHPEDGAPVEAGIGRFGPFVKHGQDLRQHPRPRGGLHHRDEPRRWSCWRRRRSAAAAARRRRRCASSASIPTAARSRVYAGRYGPYVKWEKVNATLPKEIAPEAVTLEQALELIAAKRPAGKKRAGPKKAAARKRRRAGRRPSPPRHAPAAK